MSLARAAREQCHPAVIITGVMVALMMPVAVFAPLGEAPLEACAGLALLIRIRSEISFYALGSRLVRSPITLLFLALLGWAAISCFWAPGGLASIKVTLEVAGTTLAGMVALLAVPLLNRAERRMLLSALMLGLVVGGGLLAFELIFDGPISRVLRKNDLRHGYSLARFKRGLTILAILVWPAAYYFQATKGKFAGLAVIACGATLVLLSTSRAAMLGLLVAVLLAAMTLIKWERLAKGILGFVVVAALAGPAISGKLWEYLLVKGIYTSPLEDYQLGRLGIWDYAVDLFLQSPIFGWGMDASRYIPPDPVNRYRHLELHPHNATLQITLELGLPGLIIVCAGIYMTVRQTLYRADLMQRASAIAMLVSILLVCAVGYGVWQVWWQATAWLAIMLLALAWREKELRADG